MFFPIYQRDCKCQTQNLWDLREKKEESFNVIQHEIQKSIAIFLENGTAFEICSKNRIAILTEIKRYQNQIFVDASASLSQL